MRQRDVAYVIDGGLVDGRLGEVVDINLGENGHTAIGLTPAEAVTKAQRLLHMAQLVQQVQLQAASAPDPQPAVELKVVEGAKAAGEVGGECRSGEPATAA
jgi:hypothetical protein